MGGQVYPTGLSQPGGKGPEQHTVQGWVLSCSSKAMMLKDHFSEVLVLSQHVHSTFWGLYGKVIDLGIDSKLKSSNGRPFSENGIRFRILLTGWNQSFFPSCISEAKQLIQFHVRMVKATLTIWRLPPLWTHIGISVWFCTSPSSEQKSRLNRGRYKQNHFENLLEDLRHCTWLVVIGSTLNRALCQPWSRFGKSRMLSYKLQTLWLQLNSLFRFAILIERKFISTTLVRWNTHMRAHTQSCWPRKILDKNKNTKETKPEKAEMKQSHLFHKEVISTRAMELMKALE